MNTITSSESGNMHAHASMPSASSDQGMRDLLRDTALLVTTLSTGGTCTEPPAFRTQCRQLLEQFSHALERRGFPPDIREEALIAQCGLLDETALRYLPLDARAEWEQRPLQVEQSSCMKQVNGYLKTSRHACARPRHRWHCWNAIRRFSGWVSWDAMPARARPNA